MTLHRLNPVTLVCVVCDTSWPCDPYKEYTLSDPRFDAAATRMHLTTIWAEAARHRDEPGLTRVLWQQIVGWVPDQRNAPVRGVQTRPGAFLDPG